MTTTTTTQKLLICFIGANLTALGSGTPYLYSFYAPQLLARCKIPIANSSTLTFALTVGQSALGLPAGLFIDRFGPQLSCVNGIAATFLGYFLLYQCYLHGYSSTVLISTALIMVGVGSVFGFYSTVKCCTTNFPNHRGTAAAAPVAIYALAGVIYSSYCEWRYGDDMLGVFKFLMLACSSLIFIGCLTLKVIDQELKAPQNSTLLSDSSRRSSSLMGIGMERRDSYDSLSQNKPRGLSDLRTSRPSGISKPMNIKTKRTDSSVWSKELVGSLAFWGWGKGRDSLGSNFMQRSSSVNITDGRKNSEGSVNNNLLGNQIESAIRAHTNDYDSSAIDLENGSSVNHVTHLRSPEPQQQIYAQQPNGNTVSSLPDTATLQEVELYSSTRDISLRTIVTTKKFVCYYLILATLQGIGQMYIYSVGFLVATQLASHQETPNLNQESIQSLQVSLIATMSFFGRLISGPISDLFVKKFKAQRKWNIFFACVLMMVTSVYTFRDPSNMYRSTDSANTLQTPVFVKKLSISSIIFGIGFGFTFGTFPAIIADAFGTKGFSTLWGLMTSGGLFSVKIFSSILANDLSVHSGADGKCTLGTACYSHTFKVTSVLAILAGLLTLYMIFIKHTFKRARIAHYKLRNNV